eukprot:scaffold9990_cov99-Isochrysis_galbana.AAC.4
MQTISPVCRSRHCTALEKAADPRYSFTCGGEGAETAEGEGVIRSAVAAAVEGSSGPEARQSPTPHHPSPQWARHACRPHPPQPLPPPPAPGARGGERDGHFASPPPPPQYPVPVKPLPCTWYRDAMSEWRRTGKFLFSSKPVRARSCTTRRCSVSCRASAARMRSRGSVCGWGEEGRREKVMREEGGKEGAGSR